MSALRIHRLDEAAAALFSWVTAFLRYVSQDELGRTGEAFNEQDHIDLIRLSRTEDDKYKL